jgi:tetratricopeptide (TPR) repeat protein
MPDFDASIRLRPGNAKAYLWRGEARFLLGDKAGAAEDYGRSLTIDPNEKSAWYARSKAYQRLGRYDDALRDALQSRALGYPVPQTYIDQLRKAGGAAN